MTTTQMIFLLLLLGTAAAESSCRAENGTDSSGAGCPAEDDDDGVSLLGLRAEGARKKQDYSDPEYCAELSAELKGYIGHYCTVNDPAGTWCKPSPKAWCPVIPDEEKRDVERFSGTGWGTVTVNYDCPECSGGLDHPTWYHCTEGKNGLCFPFYFGCLHCQCQNFNDETKYSDTEASAKAFCKSWSKNQDVPVDEVFGVGKGESWCKDGGGANTDAWTVETATGGRRRRGATAAAIYGYR